MELYIHLPFCKSKCRYCDFASYAGCESLMPRYIDALLQEAALQAEQLNQPAIDTVFIGGGTPSLLPADLLARLMKGLHERFPIAAQAEFTSEANPGTLTAQWLDAAVRYGVNRLSMGMQAKQPELLQALGRIHDAQQVEQSVAIARSAGIENISLDMMFGLPGQTVAQWHESLDFVLSLQPKHLSCYGLIPEDGTPLKADLDSGKLCLPDEETERIMYDDTLAILSRNGFEQYEISNFALPGYECRHNLGYWRQVPYLGLGASASSMLPDHQAAYCRVTNPPSIHEYLSMMDEHAWHKRETSSVSPAEARFETLMLGLRTTKGISENDYATMHGSSLQNDYGATLSSLAERHLLIHENGWWRLTRRGMDVQNGILVELMDEETPDRT